MLITWVAVCLVHAATSKQHPILPQYGVALDYRDLRYPLLSDLRQLLLSYLRHLLLSNLRPVLLSDLCPRLLNERAADNAVLAMAAYLQRHTQPGMQMFTLSNGGHATYAMAEQYAQNGSLLFACICICNCSPQTSPLAGSAKQAAGGQPAQNQAEQRVRH